MCGVFSITHPARSSGAAVSREAMQEALAKGAHAMHHRGPDGKGYWLSDDHRTGLAHARLSIIDLNTGAQPITNETGRIAIIVNGEVYDFETIRADLIRRGHRFKTGSDSEIALHLYEEYGTDFVHHLRGEFALILYDQDRNRLIAARDRFGIKPLVYTITSDGTLYCASEAKALFAAGALTPEWDEDAYNHACAMQYLPADKTLFKGVMQLRPGMMLVHQNGAMTIAPYWDLDYPREDAVDAGQDFSAAKTRVHDLLKDAVSVRMRADVPVCCHLSGGIDSATIAGMAADLSDRPVTCFTVSFDDGQSKDAQNDSQIGGQAANAYDELPIAREQAARIGADLHVVRLTSRHLVDAIDAAVEKTEGLAINGHLAGKYFLSEAIRKQGFIVTLSGEGSDEIFAGYPHFREDVLRHGTDGALKDALSGLYESNSKLAGVFLADGQELDTAALQEKIGFVPSFLRAKASLGFRVSGLLCRDFTTRMEEMGAGANPFAALGDFFDHAGQLDGRGVVDRSAYLWTKMTLANYILKTLGDGCEMAHSIEGRVPFLDHSLFEYVRGLPLDFKIRADANGTLVEKFILREAARPYLSDTLYTRQKHPFIAPPISAGKDLQILAGDLMHSAAMDAQPFFDKTATLAWFNSLQSLSPREQIAAEPVLMMIMTTLSAQRHFFSMTEAQSYAA